MREILFRGKIRNSEEWTAGYLCRGSITDYSIEPANDLIHRWAVHTETIGQYTGLEDKNGVKIFEGDILSISLNLPFDESIGGVINVNWKTAVEYEDGSFKIEEDGRLYPLSEYVLTGRAEFEVIGNIHDNPELR